MEAEALALRREYQRNYARKWRSKNKEKNRIIQQRYWEKKAKELNIKGESK